MLSPHGSVTAALAAHRAAIHYRSSSIPLAFSFAKKNASLFREVIFFGGGEGN